MTTETTETTDFGSLYVGDRILTKNDFIGKVLAFPIPAEGAPTNRCIVVTDMGTEWGIFETLVQRIGKAHVSPLPETWVLRGLDEDSIMASIENTGALA